MSQPIVVTGAAGFIGARFVESCQKKEISVVSVDQTAFFADRREHQGIHFGEIVDLEKLHEWLPLQASKPQAIVHLGACTDTTEMDVALLKRVNLEYSQKLWTYASTHRIPFVYASSAATYGEGEFGYDDQEELLPKLKPLNPYGDSKHQFDLWALDQEKKGISPPNWAGFKFFNVYGFGERHKNKMASVVLHAFDQINASGQVKLFKSHRDGIADGHQQRDFVYVDDLVNTLHFALEKPISRGIYNLGTGEARTFLDLVKAVFWYLGARENITFIDTPPQLRERYQYFTEAKMNRLRAKGYTFPFTSLEEGVRQYVERLTR